MNSEFTTTPMLSTPEQGLSLRSRIPPIFTPTDNVKAQQSTTADANCITPAGYNVRNNDDAEQFDDSISSTSGCVIENGEWIASDDEEEYVRTLQVRTANEVASRNIDMMLVQIFGTMSSLVTELRHANTNACALRNDLGGGLEGRKLPTKKRSRMRREVLELARGAASMDPEKRRR